MSNINKKSQRLTKDYRGRGSNFFQIRFYFSRSKHRDLMKKGPPNEVASEAAQPSIAKD
jgi:hypothetical protein